MYNPPATPVQKQKRILEIALTNAELYLLSKKKPYNALCAHKFCPILNLLVSFESHTIKLGVFLKLV